MTGYSLLLLITLSCYCSAEGDRHDNPPVSMTMGIAKSPDQSDFELTGQSQQNQGEQQEALWRTEVLDVLKQLALEQKEVAKHQGEVVQLLGTLRTQGSQQIRDLQSVVHHQGLLVENHQALLLQTSRIITHLQEINKKPPAAQQSPATSQ